MSTSRYSRRMPRCSTCHFWTPLPRVFVFVPKALCLNERKSTCSRRSEKCGSCVARPSMIKSASRPACEMGMGEWVDGERRL